MNKIKYSNITGRDGIFRDSPVPSRPVMVMLKRDGTGRDCYFQNLSRPVPLTFGTGPVRDRDSGTKCPALHHKMQKPCEKKLIS